MMRGAVLGLLLLSAQGPATPRSSPPPTPRPAPRRAGLSWTDADILANKIQQVEDLRRAGKPVPKETVLVTEGQLNSYLNLSLAGRMPKGVADLDFRFERERLAARALVDLEGLPKPAWLSLLGLGSGTIPVDLKGRLPTRDGVGSIDLEEARLSGQSFSIPLLAELVSASTRTATSPQGFDIRAPFRLPYAVRSVRFEPGKAIVEF